MLETNQLVEKSSNEYQKLKIDNWFAAKKVSFLEKITGDEAEDEQWLKEVGVLASTDQYTKAEAVTSKYLNTKDSGGGWHRGGAESFYKICEIWYKNARGDAQKRIIAFKAIVTFGSVQEKMITEAVWMTMLAGAERSSRVYAVGNGTIVKEFLEQDSLLMTAEDRADDYQKLLDTMKQLELDPPQSGKLETIQSGGKLKIIDVGSGDIFGPAGTTIINR